MTGFAAVTREDERASVAVTIRALNHRYLDLQLRTPQSLAALEVDIRAQVGKTVARGRVELSVSVQPRQAQGVEIEFNEEFGRALEAALEKARARGLVRGALAPGDLLRLPQALTIRERQAGDDPAALAAMAALARGAVEQALGELDAMRATEGDHVRADLDARRSLVADLVERIAVAADEGRAAMEARVAERVRQLRTELQADEAAVAQEIVRMAARSDISEEVTRFRGHVSHWVTLADSAEPCGRKLDFLLQEMNREVNTMGSKADGLRVSELIIAAKAELEKMREQVQNVE
ncbi:MAG: YicC family protein [Acidobacteriia bacterium]|nr:YicC family protein [Terriglobia bacterium]